MAKRVKFHPRLDKIHILKDRSSEMINELTPQLWYTKEELDESRKQVKVAGHAVNDACGDFDIDYGAETPVQAVLRKQAELRKKHKSSEDGTTFSAWSEHVLASLSRELSMSSTELARLYALVLEKDVDDVPSVTYEALLEIVNRVMFYDGDENDDEGEENDNVTPDDDMESIGTIDQMPENGPANLGAIDELDCFEMRTDSDQRVRGKAARNQDCFVGAGIESDITKIDNEQKIDANMGINQSSSCKADVKNSPVSPAVEIRHKEKAENFNETDKKRSVALLDEVHENERNVRQRREETSSLIGEATAQLSASQTTLSYREETQNRCNVAHALISLARWEFRSHNIFCT